MKFFILENRKPVEITNMLTWATWFEQNESERTVAVTELPGGIEVSTVFMGLLQHYDERDPPYLYETLIFGGPHKGYRTRSCTWAEAKLQHRVAVEIAQNPSLLEAAPLDEDV
jgi:hypothetical protein